MQNFLSWHHSCKNRTGLAGLIEKPVNRTHNRKALRATNPYPHPSFHYPLLPPTLTAPKPNPISPPPHLTHPAPSHQPPTVILFVSPPIQTRHPQTRRCRELAVAAPSNSPLPRRRPCPCCAVELAVASPFCSVTLSNRMASANTPSETPSSQEQGSTPDASIGTQKTIIEQIPILHGVIVNKLWSLEKQFCYAYIVRSLLGVEEFIGLSFIWMEKEEMLSLVERCQLQ
ncbi:hypothetical protein AHAS_Ahas05G0077900 [Arachis hypogaea]